MSRDAVRRAIRTFLQAFLALLIPGLLGWLNDLTAWARDEGATPFPDARGLAYVAVAAIVAGVIAVVNLLWNVVEDAAGAGLLREVPADSVPPGGQRGAVDAVTVVVVVLVVLILILLGFVR